MPRTFICLHCSKTLLRNPRLKKQKYCSGKECQQVRRLSWKKKQYTSNRSYRKKHLEVQQSWREQRPVHQYQSDYREDHPEYVRRNRELQQQRNKKRKKDQSAMIVNGNSLTLHPSSGMAYAILQVKKLNDCKWELVHGQNVGIIRSNDDLVAK